MGFWNWFGGKMGEGDEEPTESATEDDTGDADDPVDTDREVGPDVVEMEHRIGELEEEIERTGGRIENVQHSQQEVAERVEELNGTVRDLTGIYERLTADVNPFTDAEEGDGKGNANGSGFGVVNGDGERAGAARANGDGDEDEEEHEHDGDEDEGEHEHAPGTIDDTAGDDPVAGAHDAEVPDEEDPLLFDEGEHDTDDVFTFDDAVADLEREADSDGSTDEGPMEAATPDEDGRESMGSGGEAVTPATNGDSTGRGAVGPDDRTPYLTELADGYATDVLALEWLAELVEVTGPTATLKAISYYEDVDWIGPSVASNLEEYLAGPGIDIHVDPNEPMELSIEDHVTSYEYILKLGVIRELEHTA
jgi:archaellum component FlaD/FlaE